ncbi:MAG: hypothetical protein PHF20_01815 [Halothiobacillaceae bacterium]|nr:hypothetical protein [Halothiobacillaceae bacterium]
MLQSLSRHWDTIFPSTQPIGYLFRELYPERWVRFHSLPESKRYAENRAEYAEIFSRQNQILSELIHDPEIILLTTTPSISASPHRITGDGRGRRVKKLARFDPHAKFWRTVAMHELEDKDEAWVYYYHIFASRCTFAKGSLDRILALVADFVEENVFILSLNESWLFLPYDGGVDVILPSPWERDRLKEKYKAWLSTESSGL